VPTVPVAGMALILGIDRFMSECRALTNFIGNGVATVVVSKWENELDHDRMTRELKSPTHIDDDRELYPVRQAA
jgi:aerobic C4-dicarboxylate transport protein